MKDLIAKLEAAKEGSRELDAEIGRAFGHVPKTKNIYKRGHYNANGPVLLRVQEIWPAYSTSIDAALTLVPEGWLPSCGIGRNDLELHGNANLYGYAELDIEPYDGTSIVAYAATPALALCIAALKAIEATR